MITAVVILASLAVGAWFGHAFTLDAQWAVTNGLG